MIKLILRAYGWKYLKSANPIIFTDKILETFGFESSGDAYSVLKEIYEATGIITEIIPEIAAQQEESQLRYFS